MDVHSIQKPYTTDGKNKGGKYAYDRDVDIPDTEEPMDNLFAARTQRVTPRHWLIWPVALLFMTAYQMSFATFGQYVYVKLQLETFPNLTLNTTTSHCVQNTSSTEYLIQLLVQEKAATWGIYLYMSGGVTTIFASFIMGAFTDRYGRKFLFVVPCIGTLIRTGAVVAGIHYNLPLFFYIPFFFLEGCTGQIFTILQVAYIYVSDITPVGKRRSIAIVSIEVAIGLGTSIPNLAVGYLLKYTSFVVPIIVSTGLLVLTLFLVILLPETYTKEIRGKRKYTSKLENLKDSADLFFSSKNYGRRWMYVVTLVVFTLTTYNLFGRNSMEGLYFLNSPFCWSPEKLGIFGALRSGFQQIVGMGLVLVFHICSTDEVIAIIGCISYGASFVLEALATSDVLMYVVTAIGSCGLLTIPMIRSIMSQMTAPDKQGAVFASISAAETTINLVGAVTANSIYLATVEYMRGFTFMLFAAFSGIGMILMIAFTVITKNSQTKYYHKF